MSVIERRTNSTYGEDDYVTAVLLAVSSLGKFFDKNDKLSTRKHIAWCLFRQLITFPENPRDFGVMKFPNDECFNKVAEIMETPLVGVVMFGGELKVFPNILT